MTEQPLVSIIIPCYNYGEYISETIASIRKQTYKNWNIIIADDGSDLKTKNILKNFETDSQIKVIYLENGGPSYARNRAIEFSQAKYILPLDSDDRIGESYIELAVIALEKNSNLGIVYCDARFFGSNTEKWNLPPFKFPEFLLDNSIFVSSFFRKKDWELVQGFDESFKDEWEDYDFWLKLIELGREVYKIPEELFFYRKGHTSRTSRFGLEYLPIYEKLIQNHSKLYSDNVLFFISQIIQLRIDLETREKNIAEKIYNSYTYRLGNLFMKPLKFIKRFYKS